MNKIKYNSYLILISKKGFSLVEFMISLLIFAVGLIAVAGMQITSITGNSFSNNLTKATILAQSRLEELKRLDYSSSCLNAGQFNEGTLSGSIFSRTYSITDLSPTMKAITVTIQWLDKSNHSISLSTIRSKP